jgi:endonuclease/exonuclease/phosphatase family metal-dependent hydrolase
VELFDRRWERSFYFYNVHLDAGSVSNRLRSAELIARRIRERPKPELPVLLAGDFNALRWFPVMRIIRSAGLETAPSAGSTFHFNRGLHLFGAIDHLLYSEEFIHRESRVLRSSRGGVYPSDHYPLVVLFGLGE